MGKHKKLYNDLGVNDTADATEIKKAYRKKVKKAHPDHGGSEEDFQKINKAYLVLSNPDSRSKYDNTGDENLKEPDNQKSQVMTMIAGIMEACITEIEGKGKDPANYDIPTMMRQKFKDQLVKMENNIAGSNKLIAKTKRLLGRFKVKKGNNFLEPMLLSKIDSITLNIANINREMIPIKAAYDMLMDVTFNFDEVVQQTYASYPLGSILGQLGV